jgi:phosphohistidine phosphatase
MKLFLQRHAQPVKGHPMDATRELNEDGKAQADAMGDWFRDLTGRCDIVISSPFARAMQTAKIMADKLGCHVADTRMLQPDGNPKDAWAEIERLAQQSKDVLVVSHDPLINALLMWLLGLDAGVPEVRFEWGAIAHVRFKAKPSEGIKSTNTLAWLVDPKLVLKQDDEITEAARAVVESLEDLDLRESLLPDEDHIEQVVKMRLVSELEDGGTLVQLEPA